MSMVLKFLGGLMLAFSLLPAAFSIHQSCAAYDWTQGSLAGGELGELGKRLAQRGYEIRRDRAMAACGIATGLGLPGMALVLGGFAFGRRRQRSGRDRPAASVTLEGAVAS